MAGRERGVELTHAVPVLGNLPGVDGLVCAADQRCERTVVAVGIDPVDALVLDSAEIVLGQGGGALELVAGKHCRYHTATRNCTL